MERPQQHYKTEKNVQPYLWCISCISGRWGGAYKGSNISLYSSCPLVLYGWWHCIASLKLYSSQYNSLLQLYLFPSAMSNEQSMRSNERHELRIILRFYLGIGYLVVVATDWHNEIRIRANLGWKVVSSFLQWWPLRWEVSIMDKAKGWMWRRWRWKEWKGSEAEPILTGHQW